MGLLPAFRLMRGTMAQRGHSSARLEVTLRLERLRRRVKSRLGDETGDRRQPLRFRRHEGQTWQGRHGGGAAYHGPLRAGPLQALRRSCGRNSVS